ncbi:MAG: hypothetical protein KGQ70_05835 [Alphaproteobacteria bacterium]|nr:hypothetical protein [Alphaproteobacteria bacterium]
MLLRLSRYASITLLYTGLLFAVTACSDSGNSPDANAAPPPPQASPQQVPGIAPVPTAMDTLRALAPPDGLKFTPLFSQRLSGTNARIARLESAVQTLRNDVDTMAPTVVRMVAIEGDVKGLVTQLQTLTNQNQSGQTQQGATGAASPQELPPALPASAGGEKIPEEDVAKGTEPAMADEATAGPAASSSLVTPEAASKGQLPPAGAASPISKIQSEIQPQGLELGTGGQPPESAAAEAAAGSVVNMSIADLPEKTRLVLDLTAEAPVKMHMSGKDRTLVIDLAHYRWGGRDTWASDQQKLITGGHVKGGMLYVNLKRASSYKALKLLPPSGNDKNYRLVIDLYNKPIRKEKPHPAPQIQPAATPSPAPAGVPDSQDNFP